MNLEEIENRAFAVSLRGYARDEVDAFKDEVAQELRAARQELDAALSRLEESRTRQAKVAAELAAAGRQLSETQAKLKAAVDRPRSATVEEAEQVLSEERSAAFRQVGQETEKILMAAEQVAEEMHERAIREAAGIVADARIVADRTFAEIEDAKRAGESELHNIREARSMIASQMEDIGRRLSETVARLRVPVESPGNRGVRPRQAAAEQQAVRERQMTDPHLRERQAAELLRERRVVDPQALRERQPTPPADPPERPAAERQAAQREAAERQAAQREAAEREAAEREAVAERKAAQREAAEREAAEREAAEREAAERETAERKAAEQQAEAGRLAHERAAAEQKEVAERQIAEQELAERRAAAQKEVAEQQAEAAPAAGEQQAAGAAIEVPARQEAEKGIEAATVAKEAKAAESSSLSELLDEIRRNRETEAAAPAAKPEPAVVPAPADPTLGKSEPAEPDSSMIEIRAQSLGDLPVQTFRRLKRLLQEDHNDLLDRLRTQRGKGSLEDNLAPLPEQFGRFQAGLSENLSTAFSRGRQAGGGSGAADPGKVVSNLVARQVVNPLRSEVSKAIQGGLEAQDTASSIAERASDVFRVWKGVRTELLGEGMVYAAFNQGLVDAWSSRPNRQKVWVASDDEDECPNGVCARNVSAGAVALKAAFPSGHLTPPAHGGCTCTLRDASV